MILVNEMKPMFLYRRPFHLPIDVENKRKGYVTFLLTPDYESTKNLLLNPMLINRDYYESYYIEKAITYMINQEGYIMGDLNDEVLNESSDLDKYKRKIKYHANKRKYKAKQKLQDIKNNISGNNIGGNPKLSSPNIKPASIKENIIIESDYTNILEGAYYGTSLNEATIDEHTITCRDDHNSTLLTIFNENLDPEIFKEDANYNTMLYKILYKERLKTNKDVFQIYDKITTDIPYINRAYLSYDRYKGKNLFVDMSYYNEAFFNNNNMYKQDKAVKLYCEFIYRFIFDKRLTKEYSNRTVFVPVNDWVKAQDELNYTKEINPISMIIRAVKKYPEELSKFQNVDFVFIGTKGYFKAAISTITKTDLNKFIILLNKLETEEEIIDNPDKATTKAIVSDVIDKIETSQKIKINNLTGNGGEIDKDELVQKISQAAAISKDAEDTLDHMGNDSKIKEIISALADEEDGNIKINAARASRIAKLQQEFLDKKIANTTIKEMIESSEKDEELPTTQLSLDTINEEWKDLKYPNFEKVYNPDEDIVRMLYSLHEKSMPVAVRDIKVEDTSTSEDYVKTYIVNLEDALGGRFTIKFDVPELMDNKFMMLRGNQKSISGQLTLIPISKTDGDAVQIVSNYKKMFIKRFYTSTGKSCATVDRIMKTLNKNEFKSLTIKEGDGSRVSELYDLPMDYIDLANSYSKLITKNHEIFLNQEEIREKYKIDDKKGIPVAISRSNNEVLYYSGVGDRLSDMILGLLSIDVPGFREAFDKTTIGSKYTYSKASILSTEIPLIVMMAFSEGLTKSMDKANIKYEFSEKRIHDKNTIWDVIKFKDGYLFYEDNYVSSLLMNGLKECNIQDYPLGDMNKKSMYIDFLEKFGGRILSDGLDNFYDLMLDSITLEVLEKYKLPTDYISLLAYANLLLVDNKYIAHTDMAGRRYRSNELIAGYAYQAIADSYASYRTGVRKKGKDVMVMKQSAVIDKIMADPTSSDVSVLNDLQLLEVINSVSYKGLAGMNSDRSYGLDKRAYDDTMLNLLGLSTGFAGNVGLTRQATLDMNVESKRGYLKLTKNTDDLNVTKTLTATEALTPFGTTRDDPFRSAMTFIQTSKHSMRVKKGMPSLISNGADQALPYLTPNIFSFKTRDAGKIIEKTDDYMIIQYKDGTNDFVDLRSNIKKNSNGGFYGTVKLDTDLKLGSIFKKNEIIAYDKLSYSDAIGDRNDGIAYKLGTLSKFAILSTDEGYEDSAIISNKLTENLSSEVVIKKEIILDKNCNVYNVVKKGQRINEGDPLLIFQNAFEDEDINILMKNLAGDEDEISDLGRIRVKSKITGWVEDIKIYKTVENDELSDSLKKLVNAYEKPLNGIKKVMGKHHINSKKIESTEKLDPVGKVKNAQDGILIEFYLKYMDNMSIGDKIVYYSALKGVVKDIYPIGKEPYTDLRPNEPINTVLSIGSVNGRMVCSIKIASGINKLIIELDRTIKDRLGIPWTDLDNIG